MLRYFINSSEKPNKEFNIGYIKESNMLPFNFAYLNREDITNNLYLSNLELSDNVFLIETSDDIDLSTNNTIIIDQVSNHIRSFYIEYAEDHNNAFNIKAKKRTIITLIKEY